MGNELKLIFRKFSKYISKGELIFHTGTTLIIKGIKFWEKSATVQLLKLALSTLWFSKRNLLKRKVLTSFCMLEYNKDRLYGKELLKESSYIINGELIKTKGKSMLLNY